MTSVAMVVELAEMFRSKKWPGVVLPEIRPLRSRLSWHAAARTGDGDHGRSESAPGGRVGVGSLAA
ncbi:hypothetical protein [Micromonospora sp. LOL_024]|uniref:hypothetical protein n=1 Tax=Micromonospora sp. LOL_024 TaxID=3345412 RepID=UPI003A8879A8